MIKAHYPLVIIGAGPAGLAAASVAAGQGIEVALFDQQSAPGGQIYRGIESVSAQRAEQLGADYRRGEELVRAFRSSNAQYFPDTQVWSLTPGREIGLLRAVGARETDIIRQFLVEASVIALLGALIGVLLGVALAYVIAAFAGWAVAWSLLVILVAVLVCVSIAVGFGVYPAVSAARMDPVLALQSD